MAAKPLNVFCTTWNTGLQGSKAQQQDLTSWLLPVLHRIDAETPEAAATPPDIYAIAVQELLPVHLALAGFSAPVLVALTTRIQSLLSSHASSLSPIRAPETYLLVSRVCHGGNALWVFAREATLGGRLGRAVDATLGLWWGGLSNKSAVGVRVPVRRRDDSGWEVLTFVNTHLEAHDKNIPRRNTQYQNILSSLLFKSREPLTPPRQITDTSHLFLMGDLNYRLDKSSSLVFKGEPREGRLDVNDRVEGEQDRTGLEKERAELVLHDTLRAQQKAGKVFGGLREGRVEAFAPTYKRIVGQVEGYSRKRIPGWTDRILFASHTDSPLQQQTSSNTTRIINYASSPELTISDHKPVYALIRIDPSPSTSGASPNLAPFLPPAPPPHVRPPPISTEELILWKTSGWILNRLIGYPWCLLVLLGAGNLKAGMGVSAFVCMVWGVWWTGLVNGNWSG